MLRIILGIVAGFILWSILWLGSDSLYALISPGWYGRYMNDFHQAVDKNQPFTAQTSILLVSLVTSFVCSLASGLAAVTISRELSRTTLILGILLFLAGLVAEGAFRNYLPVWYHLTFLILLIPMTIAGGKLKMRIR